MRKLPSDLGLMCRQSSFLTREQALSYAQNRASFRSGEIRILDSNGVVGGPIPLNKANRNCDVPTLRLICARPVANPWPGRASLMSAAEMLSQDPEP